MSDSPLFMFDANMASYAIREQR